MEEEINHGCNNASTNKGVLTEKRGRPQEQLNCPRCNSTNTKFCYYNNYSLTQPRYLCKTCRRYWTEGGTLRNVPVGGGSRKNKKSIPSSSSSSSLSLSQQFPCQNPRVPPPPPQPQPHPHQGTGQDLSPSFHKYYSATQYMQVSKSENNTGTGIDVVLASASASVPCSSSSSSSSCSSIEMLRSGSGIGSRGVLNSLIIQTPMPDSNAIYPSGFYNWQQVNPTTLGNFCADGLGSRYVPVQDNNNNIDNGGSGSGSGSGRILFPFGDFKQVSSSAGEVDQNKGQGNPTGYWNGLLGGGGGSSW